ncbi:Receptor-type guanylate cyclase gcy [Seminavis robusta]|uniref:Receptor-type guanylate cyclase gcy n=1 Tax=Seminavis robusta TaxID=568900 RepID=A0A9N8EBM9_9STRA|nr:Receptor-type guanylate cyclase gcy [Seminavis robusta]|eukprot:Sro910_g219070.1 Receptor-type guanylate cyclase gcy (1419) ;mRNA; f:3480-9794
MAPYQTSVRLPARSSLSGSITAEALARLELATNELYQSGSDDNGGDDQSDRSGVSSYLGDEASEFGTIASSRRSDNHTSPEKIAEQLSQRESMRILRLRVIVISVLFLTALAISSVVFKITTDGEVDEFTTQYESASSKVIATFEDVMNRMGSVAGLGLSFTSQGMHTQEQWPFMTLNDFPPKARNALQLSGALMVGMSPIVQGHLFDEWDNYVIQPQNTEWINQSLTYQAELHLNHSSSVSSSNRPVDVMHYFDHGAVVPEVPGKPWYLPVWQTAPYIPDHGLVNNNLLRYENTTDFITNVITHGHAVVSEFYGAPPGTTASDNADTALFASLRTAKEKTSSPYLGDPLSNLYIPVFDTFSTASAKSQQQTVVGVLHAIIHWKSYFKKILPDNVQRIIVVLEYQCGGGDNDNNDDNDNTTTEAPRRDLATTFTIIDESEASTDPNSYWALPSSVPPEEEITSDADNNDGNSYWEIDQFSTQTAMPEPTNPLEQEEQPEQTAMPEPTQQPEQEEHEEEERDPVNVTTDDFFSAESSQETNHNGTSTDDDDDGPSFFTYYVEGSEAHAIGYGDHHDPRFDHWMRVGTFATRNLDDGTVGGIPVDQQCSYHIYVYPTQSFYDEFITTTPLHITMGIVVVFIFAIVMFLMYNRLVEKRQQKVLQKATQSTAIVASLFPKNVRDRLLAGGNLEKEETDGFGIGNKSRLKGFMAGETEGNDEDEQPIADLFPHCTVFFCDIAGFTAWSSTREPAQVFILLQGLYQAFDQLAKRRHVFKVETIGDSYMAVTGLPDPQEHHASIMVRFAWGCIVKMKEVTKRLERTLGPDTTELSMRIGLHSGPVTAGVLRGDRARFQLFGDTVNTASRMESTGVRGKIQVSETTANHLRDAGKDHWVKPREDVVKAKGKGVLRTYWANPKNKRSENGSSSWDVGSSEEPVEDDDEDDNGNSGAQQQAQDRLVDWIVKLLSDDILKILSARARSSAIKANSIGNLMKGANAPAPTYHPPEGKTCMDEVKEVIRMPKTVAKSDERKVSEIPDEALHELGEYVTGIALMYRNNPFHNFEHACHVTMSVNKLIRRIVNPDISAEKAAGLDDASKKLAMHVHDFSYGFSSDPLAMFAMTFSALIHDVDHRGISNMQLAKEEPEMATMYHSKSVAEQNSLDVAWDLLMEDRFSNLRKCLFESKEELMRFRQLIVNVVLATDIFDKELNDLRKNRWRRAFSGEGGEESDRSDLRATIVIEHIIQASDVSHCMQHWHVYQKWNRCLFREMHTAFKQGRLGKDPAGFWYKGEMGFFDNYIIPLAKKLKDCGVFGVSSDEYLNYAVQNRAEWEERGAEIVATMVEEVAEDNLATGSTTVRKALKRFSAPPEQMMRDAMALQESLNGGAKPPKPSRGHRASTSESFPSNSQEFRESIGVSAKTTH